MAALLYLLRATNLEVEYAAFIRPARIGIPFPCLGILLVRQPRGPLRQIWAGVSAHRSFPWTSPLQDASSSPIPQNPHLSHPASQRFQGAARQC